MAKTKEELKDKRLQDTYGITLAEWEEMLLLQNNVCAMCKTMPNSGVLCVDHIHIAGYKKMEPQQKKKYVRALVCFLCNTSFGRIERRKNPRQLLSYIVDFFSKHPMKGDRIE